MATAQIVLTQGVTVSPPATSLMGVTGTTVQVANSVVQTTYTFTVIDVPPGSAVPLGVVQTGSTPTWNFTPDLPGGYCVMLTTIDASGNTASDTQVFGVPTASGRFIPPFTGNAASLNFAGQARGWSPHAEAWLYFVDAIDVPFRVLTVAVTLSGILQREVVFDSSATGANAPIIITLPPTSALYDGCKVFFYDEGGALAPAGSKNVTVDANTSQQIVQPYPTFGTVASSALLQVAYGSWAWKWSSRKNLWLPA